MLFQGGLTLLGGVGAAASIRGFGVCFTRDTPVATPSGPKPIGQVEPDEPVMALDFGSGCWQACPVLARIDSEYTGRLPTLSVGEDQVRVTEGHPFRVVSGEGLQDRRTPGKLDPGEDQGQSYPGRWVSGEDLLVGDELLDSRGRRVVLARMDTERVERLPVSNLSVAHHPQRRRRAGAVAGA